jgi:hypothetical protein
VRNSLQLKYSKCICFDVQMHSECTYRLRNVHSDFCLTVSTWSDNKIPELATVCLRWQLCTKALVWFYGSYTCRKA